jgi:hypothetical protein
MVPEIAVVFVCGKYMAGTKEERDHWVNAALVVAKELLHNGFVPIVPHCITYGWEDDPRFSNIDWVTQFYGILLARCDALVIANGLDNSPGLAREVELAKKITMPVYTIEEFRIKFYEKRNKLAKDIR